MNTGIRLKNVFEKNRIKGKRKIHVKVPTVLQMEAVECGAASLAMILAWHGRYAPLEELRISCGVSRDGSKASNIIKAARQYGLSAKGMRMDVEAVKNIEYPAIIHWNFNHFLVLEGYGKGVFYLRDPASGPRKVKEEEFGGSFTGVVMLFQKGEDFKSGGSKPDVFSALLKRLEGKENALAFTALTALLLVVPGLILPVFSKIFVDDILIRGRKDWMTSLILAMAGTALVRGVITWIQSFSLLKLKSKISLQSSGKFLWHVLRLPTEFFSQRYAGDISSRMASNDKVAEMLTGRLAKAFLNMLFILLYFVFMLQYSVPLTAICVFFSATNILLLRYSADIRTDAGKKAIQEGGKMMGTSMAGLQNIETLKATAQESDFFSKWSGQQAKMMASIQDGSVIGIFLSSLPQGADKLAVSMILAVGGLLIMQGKMTIGDFIAFQSLMAGFSAPVQEMMTLAGDIQTLEGDMNRLDDVMKYKKDTVFDREEENAPAGFEGRNKLEGGVELRNISFGYSPLEPPLIENFSLKLRPGCRVALVGGSGSGKSTIANVIAGLNKPWTGEILFDGVPVDKIPRTVINNSLAVVNQEVSMFSGTLQENLTLWDDSIPEKDIISAAKDSCIHDDITARPGGYAHVVEEGGVNFSGGQRQRMEIARALVNKPTILIMDEATSALDPKVEKDVDDNIRRRGCTCIIVAHRLSTIRDCDEIIVLDRGKIVQRGTHDEMLNVADGPYAKLIKAV